MTGKGPPSPAASDGGLDLPSDPRCPFFAYGVFRPGQLAYFQLRDLVVERAQSIDIPGRLLVRDGLPIADLHRPRLAPEDRIIGALLTFQSDRSTEAYDRIARMEPRRHYVWDEISLGGATANVLRGRSPGKGSSVCEQKEWDGWTDPTLTAALEVVEETLAQPQRFTWDLKPMFRLQMAYLLLWSSIERYVSLRYHLGDRAMEKVHQLADEPAFAQGLRVHVTERREIYRADKPTDKEVISPRRTPHQALAYYYQVRSNITHRGKGVVADHDKLQKSLAELLSIFREVLTAAHDQARADAR